MGHEDKLTHRQRVRLEAIAQAHLGLGSPMNPRVTWDQVKERANLIEKFLWEADNGTQ